MLTLFFTPTIPVTARTGPGSGGSRLRMAREPELSSRNVSFVGGRTCKGASSSPRQHNASGVFTLA